MIRFSRFCQLAAAVVMLTPVFTIDSAAHAQRSYPMTCRGGGRLGIQNDGSGGVRINFQAGPGAATQGLAPGQCTWSDRALGSNEPKTICDSAASAAQYVNRLVSSDAYSIFQVYNNRRSCMQVTRVGP